jgi:uncharacterized membrane protein YhaH (DUF805 family)
MAVFWFCITALLLRTRTDKTDFRKFDSSGNSNKVQLTFAGTLKKYYFDAVFKQYFRTRGRATRKEYWGFFSFNLSVIFLLGALAGIGAILGATNIALVIACVVGGYMLSTTCPAWSIQVRRYHDVGLSGWLVLLVLIPYIGALFNLIVCLLGSAPDNKYGPNKIQAGAIPP